MTIQGMGEQIQEVEAGGRQSRVLRQRDVVVGRDRRPRKISDSFGLAQEDGEECLRVRAAYSAVDMLGHVNNSRYVEWICDALPAEMIVQRPLDWVQVNYDREVRSGEEVAVTANPVPPDGNLWALQGLNRSNGTRAFEAAIDDEPLPEIDQEYLAAEGEALTRD